MSSSGCLEKEHYTQRGTQVGLVQLLTDMDSRAVDKGCSLESADMKQDLEAALESDRCIVDDTEQLKDTVREDREHTIVSNLMLLVEDCGSCSDHNAVGIHDLA